MAIAFDASTSFALVNPGTSISGSHTCTGSDRILFATTFDDVGDAGSLITGVTYNGVPLSEAGPVGGIKNVNDRWLRLWYLIAPASGANTLEATASASVVLKMMSASYTGARQSGQPVATNTGHSEAANSLALTLASVPNNAWVIFCGKSEPDWEATTPGAFRITPLDQNGLVIGDSNGAISPSASYTETLSHTAGNFNQAGIIAAFVPPVRFLLTRF